MGSSMRYWRSKRFFSISSSSSRSNLTGKASSKPLQLGGLEVHQPQRYKCAFAHIHHIHLTVPLCYHYEYICIYNHICLCIIICIFIIYIYRCVCLCTYVYIYIIYYNIHTYVTCVRASYLYLYCRTSVVPRHQDIIRHPHPSDSFTSFIPRSSFVPSTPRSIDLP